MPDKNGRMVRVSETEAQVVDVRQYEANRYRESEPHGHRVPITAFFHSRKARVIVAKGQMQDAMIEADKWLTTTTEVDDMTKSLIHDAVTGGMYHAAYSLMRNCGLKFVAYEDRYIEIYL